MKEILLKNGKTVVLREAQFSDAQNVLNYVNEISSQSDFLTFGPGEFMLSLEQEEKYLESTLNHDNALSLIAEIDGRIVGSLNFSGGGRPRIAHTGEFGVSVLKDYWGNGIGTILMEYLIEWSRNSGIIRKINLRARTDNSAAIRIYKKLGFKEEGTITRDFMIGGIFYDSLCMGYEI